MEESTIMSKTYKYNRAKYFRNEICLKCGKTFKPKTFIADLWCPDCEAKYIKKRRCLRCRKWFTSHGYENRICGPCNVINEGIVSDMAEKQNQRERNMF